MQFFKLPSKRLLVKHPGNGNSNILLATPILPQEYNVSEILLSEEVDILEERWVHPHLPKFIKDILQIQK